MTALSESDMDALYRLGERDPLVRKAFHRLRHLEGRRKFSETAAAKVRDLSGEIRSIIADAEADHGLEPGELFKSGIERRRGKTDLAARYQAVKQLHRLDLSTPKIAAVLGLRSHGTVLAILGRLNRRISQLEDTGVR